VDELAAVSKPASRADLEPTEEERVAIASIQPLSTSAGIQPYLQGARGGQLESLSGASLSSDRSKVGLLV